MDRIFFSINPVRLWELTHKLHGESENRNQSPSYDNNNRDDQLLTTLFACSLRAADCYSYVPVVWKDEEMDIENLPNALMNPAGNLNSY